MGGEKMVFYTFSRTIYEVLKLQARMKGREGERERTGTKKTIDKNPSNLCVWRYKAITVF